MKTKKTFLSILFLCAIVFHMHSQLYSYPYHDDINDYNIVANYSLWGVPEGMTNEPIHPYTLDYLYRAFPEDVIPNYEYSKRGVPFHNPHLLESHLDSDILITKDTEVFVRFIENNDHYSIRNALAYYTYDPNNPLTDSPSAEDITIIFPNTTSAKKVYRGALQPGDKISIGHFPANTAIGFLVIRYGWSFYGNGENSSSNFLRFGYNVYSTPAIHQKVLDDKEERYGLIDPVPQKYIFLSDPLKDQLLMFIETATTPDQGIHNYSADANDFNDNIFAISTSTPEALKKDNFYALNQVQIPSVSSGNDGGLESNGDLASLIAQRNHTRSTTNSYANTQKTQYTFDRTVTVKNNSVNAGLDIYFSDTGLQGTETSYVSTPSDLIQITNANAVFAIDYYQDQQRVGVGLATQTSNHVYNHTKTICDRLNGSSVQQLTTTMLNGHQIIHPIIRKANGATEYVLSFSVIDKGTSYELHSFWNIDQYPTGDYKNFQFWGNSTAQVKALATHTLNTLQQEKPITSAIATDAIPSVIVQSGIYHNGKLHLSLLNTSGASTANIQSTIRRTETATATEAFFETISLTGDSQEYITVDVNTLFDAGIAIHNDIDTNYDTLYLADGPWGIDYLKDQVQLNNFTVNSDLNIPTSNSFKIERNIITQGQLKETFNVFRTILPGDQTFNSSSYEAISFDVLNDKPLEVILVTEGLSNWNNRMRVTIPPNTVKQTITLPFSSFKDGNQQTSVIQSIKSIVFSTHGNYQSFSPFAIEIDNVQFLKNQNLTTLAINNTKSHDKTSVYPNPFISKTTIKIPEEIQSNFSLQVYTITGQLVYQEVFKTKKTAIDFRTQLKPGTYLYSIDDQSKKYTGSFIIIK
ncbi:T9SS type A sorting domain-containing protein [Aquimarina rhabdastrellae]